MMTSLVQLRGEHLHNPPLLVRKRVPGMTFLQMMLMMIHLIFFQLLDMVTLIVPLPFLCLEELVLLPCCKQQALVHQLDSDTVSQFDDSFNIINWWHEHKLTYPVLSILARDVLAVPVSTVSSESAFSTTGRTIEERWRRLEPRDGGDPHLHQGLGGCRCKVLATGGGQVP